jgi:hypothetical protein
VIEWRYLWTAPGSTRWFQCYATGKKTHVEAWNMPNNIVFEGVLHFLMDKANYRMLEAADMTPVELGKKL